MTGHIGDQPTQRQARAGEWCTCGRPAVSVFIESRFDDTGYCGRPDGGDRSGPCPFCGQARHESRCPNYQLVTDHDVGDAAGGDDELAECNPVWDAPAWFEGGPDR